MVSHTDLIYYFTDIYLNTAMKCSICKENYDMTDDVNFLDEYLKKFLTLLYIIERDKDLKIEDLLEILGKDREDKINKFHHYLEEKIIAFSLEKTFRNDDFLERQNNKNDCQDFIDELKNTWHSIFEGIDEETRNDPLKYLAHVRNREEQLI